MPQHHMLMPVPVIEVKVAGREASPKDVKATERLNRYWTEGAGAVKIGWDRPGDFDRCVRLLTKYMPGRPDQVKGHCANLHKRATGGWPGHGPAEKAVAGKKALFADVETKAAAVAAAAGMTLDDVLDLSSLGNVEAEEPTLIAEADLPEIAEEVELPEGGALLFSADGSMLYRRADGTVELVHDATTPEEIAALPPLAEPEHIDVPLVAEATPEDEETAAGTELTPEDEQVADGDGAPDAADGDAAAGDGAGTKAAGFLPCPRDKGHKGEKDGKCAECGAKLARTESKSAEVAGKAYPYLAGSVEERQQLLTGALHDAMLPDEDDDATSGGSRAYVSLDATFADYVVATVSDWSGPVTDSQSYRIPYVIDDDESVTLGTPEPVEKVVSLTPDTDASDNASVPLQGIGLAVKALGEALAELDAPQPRVLAQVKSARALLDSALVDLGLDGIAISPVGAPAGTTEVAAPAGVDGPGSKSLQGGGETALIPETELLAVEAMFADL